MVMDGANPLRLANRLIRRSIHQLVRIPNYPKSPTTQTTKAMPTGYTATLMEKGQDFPDFVLLCARAMGATIMLRDEPLDAPIPEFQPSDYSAKQLEESKEELARLLADDAQPEQQLKSQLDASLSRRIVDGPDPGMRVQKDDHPIPSPSSLLQTWVPENQAGSALSGCQT